MIIQVYIDDDTYKRLLDIRLKTGARSIEWLAESVVAEEALKFYRNRDDDPAERKKSP